MVWVYMGNNVVTVVKYSVLCVYIVCLSIQSVKIVFIFSDQISEKKKSKISTYRKFQLL